MHGRHLSRVFARQKETAGPFREVRPFYPKGFICLWVFCFSIRHDQRRTPDRAKSSASQTIKMIAEEVYEVRAEGRRIQLTTVELLLLIISVKAALGISALRDSSMNSRIASRLPLKQAVFSSHLRYCRRRMATN